jgi:hypothetical protein
MPVTIMTTVKTAPASRTRSPMRSMMIRQLESSANATTFERLLCLVHAAEKELDDFVDEEETGRQANGDKPLLPVELCQAEDALEKRQLRREDGQQQCQADESELPAVRDDVPVECGLRFAVGGNAKGHIEQRKDDDSAPASL